MNKTMMAVMAAAMMMTGGTALAQAADDCRDNAPCFEASYSCCGGAYNDDQRGGRGGYGYGCGRGYENSNG